MAHTLVTLVLLAIPVVLLLAPVLFGYVLLPTDLYDSLTLPFSHGHPVARASNAIVPDAILQFYPYKLYARDAWLSGRFGFWNPLILCGYPQYAETMATNFDVLNVLLLVLPFPVAFFVFALAPLLLGGLAMWLLCREYGMRVWIARLCAFAYMLNSSFICYLYPHFIPGSFCWVPLLILYTKRYLDTQRYSSLAAASIFCALAWLGGTVQTAAFVAVVEVVFVLSYGSRIRVSRRIGSGFLIMALGFLLSLVMWAPTLELFLNVVKDGILASTSLSRPYTVLQRLLTLPMLLTFLWPTLATVANGFSLYSMIGAYPIDFNAAIGYFPLLFAAWAGVYLRRDPRVRPFVLLVITALVLPIATPLYHFLYHRFFVVLVFGSVMLCGLGLEYVLNSEVARAKFERFSKVALILFIGISIVLLLVAGIVTLNFEAIERYASGHLFQYTRGVAFADGNAGWMRDRLHNFLTSFSLSSWTLWSSIAAIAIAALGVRRLFDSEKSSLRLLTLGTTLQLLIFAFSWTPIVLESDYPIYPSSVVTASLGSSTHRILVDRHLYRGHQYIFLNNSNMMYGIADVAGYESLLPRSFYVAFARQPSDTIPPTSLLRSLDVGHIVTGDWITLHDNIPASTLEGLHIYDVKDASRVWLSTHAVVASDSVVIASLLKDGLERDRVYLPDSLSTLTDESSSGGSATITKDEPEHIEVTAQSPSECYLVLSDTYYPGWEAKVDGIPVEILRANYAMRAIGIKPGLHKVEFNFRPLSLRLGAYGSLAGLVIVLALFFFGRPPARSEPKE